MSKPYYETEEYSEAENELDTYDDPVKLVMEYRVSEKHKDQQIADLETKLADRTEQLKIALKDFNDIQKENDKFAQQLAEKDELLRQKIEKMKSTDFIKMCKECGFMVQAKENDNQTAITELEKIKKEINLRPVIVRNCGYGDFEEILLEDVYDVIDQQIAELKGEK